MLLSAGYLGIVSYEVALALQERLVELRWRDVIGDTLLLLEHPHVFTLGRGAQESDLLSVPSSVPVYRVSRGGQATYHGPGQLVGYPIIKLEERSRDVHAYLRSLEEAIICSLQRYGIAGVRRKGFTGVWVGERKIAFIGVGIRRWVTMHGFAVNVCPDLSYFRAIVPCGIRECEITSMACETEHASISTAELAEVVCGEFARVFHYDAYAPLCTEALAVLSELNSSSPTESFEQWTK